VNRWFVVSGCGKRHIFELSGNAIPSLAAFRVPKIGSQVEYKVVAVSLKTMFWFQEMKQL
jgi:hypothetical protein